MSNNITVKVPVNAPIEKVWDCWNGPQHLNKWVHASDDWESKNAKNDLCVGGKLIITMAPKDESEEFDFVGTYTNIVEHELTELDLDDGRHVKVVFSSTREKVTITESFEIEDENDKEVQRAGWQAILNNFKKYVESQ